MLFSRKYFVLLFVRTNSFFHYSALLVMILEKKVLLFLLILHDKMIAKYLEARLCVLFIFSYHQKKRKSSTIKIK